MRVCYYSDRTDIFGYGKKILVREYPVISRKVALLRVEYLKKIIKGYVWIDE